MPTLSKLGYKQEIQGVWFGFFAPAGVPPEVVQALVPALERTVKNASIAARLQSLGIIQEWSPPPGSPPTSRRSTRPSANSIAS